MYTNDQAMHYSFSKFEMELFNIANAAAVPANHQVLEIAGSSGSHQIRR
jgi:hypothetical protein